MRIIEILNGLREHETDFSDPISGTEISVAPGPGSSPYAGTVNVNKNDRRAPLTGS